MRSSASKLTALIFLSVVVLVLALAPQAIHAQKTASKAVVLMSPAIYNQGYPQYFRCTILNASSTDQTVTVDIFSANAGQVVFSQGPFNLGPSQNYDSTYGVAAGADYFCRFTVSGSAADYRARIAVGNDGGDEEFAGYPAY